MRTDVAIVGMGTVGSALYRWFGGTVEYDPEGMGNWNDVLQTEYIFVCVPTHAVMSVLSDLRRFEGTVVVKSTTLMEPDASRIANPEFLSENSADRDIYRPICVLGGETGRMMAVEELYADVDPDIEFIRFNTFEEAMQFKYVHNMLHINRALFWNWVNEFTGNYRKHRDAYYRLYPNGGPAMDQVGPDGKKGIGGKCFPYNLREVANRTRNPLIRGMWDFNEHLRSEG